MTTPGRFIPPKNKAMHDKVSAALTAHFAKRDAEEAVDMARYGFTVRMVDGRRVDPRDIRPAY